MDRSRIKLELLKNLQNNDLEYNNILLIALEIINNMNRKYCNNRFYHYGHLFIAHRRFKF